MEIAFRRIDHIQLVVPPGQLGAARKFYLEVLGCKEISMPPGFAQRTLFWCENNGIHIHLGEDLETKRTKGHPAFEIDDVAAVRRYLESQGLKTFDEPYIAGRDRFSFYDPWQNRIEFLEFTAQH